MVPTRQLAKEPSDAVMRRWIHGRRRVQPGEPMLQFDVMPFSRAEIGPEAPTNSTESTSYYWTNWPHKTIRRSPSWTDAAEAISARPVVPSGAGWLRQSAVPPPVCRRDSERRYRRRWRFVKRSCRAAGFDPDGGDKHDCPGGNLRSYAPCQLPADRRSLWQTR